MKIHEFQAKQIFSNYKIPVPKGAVAKTPQEVKQIAEKLGGAVVVKAQIHAGGRGKGGGIIFAKTPSEAYEAGKSIIGMNLATHQTGQSSKKVKRVQVEQTIETDRELYIGITIDRALAMPVIMASVSGGMDIEDIAAKNPEKIIKAAVDPSTGFSGFHARKIAYGLGLNRDLIKQVSGIISNLYQMFMEKDCSLIEINPFVVTKSQGLLALDAKINFDDDAVGRHPDIKKLFDADEQDALELEASRHNLNYIKLDGNVGCMVNGAGLAMATMDIIKIAGASPANFLDVGGGASAEQVENAFRILLSEKNVTVVLVNIFGGILRCDRVASGIVQAAQKTDVSLPMVIRLEGTNVREANKILRESGLNFEVASTFDKAAKKVAELSGGR